ncbi:uncharacterized protein Z518_10821 [Rhinocladiella mackenziei CBS 650.93]|uniref:Rhinocladiella mackenziei CBS 650.93 unplaced genomic scaffold supercont1.10, whole genome shotgun sequence n=1 Tax=Rhinocladiella mackenziei CBS 650.93 TaxID=1442369 RepID=A0A0D2I2B4_9EURO|nr:uncharacterized protein Z518_10821 [Rhinocladiella mackenziei CBS 650.93]KIW99893.1 hypothetical protein Z518_10821 [Rhinocladiella mackenziei CBS 650.93]
MKLSLLEEELTAVCKPRVSCIVSGWELLTSLSTAASSMWWERDPPAELANIPDEVEVPAKLACIIRWSLQAPSDEEDPSRLPSPTFGERHQQRERNGSSQPRVGNILSTLRGDLPGVDEDIFSVEPLDQETESLQWALQGMREYQQMQMDDRHEWDEEVLIVEYGKSQKQLNMYQGALKAKISEHADWMKHELRNVFDVEKSRLAEKDADRDDKLSVQPHADTRENHDSPTLPGKREKELESRQAGVGALLDEEQEKEWQHLDGLVEAELEWVDRMTQRRKRHIESCRDAIVRQIEERVGNDKTWFEVVWSRRKATAEKHLRLVASQWALGEQPIGLTRARAEGVQPLSLGMSNAPAARIGNEEALEPVVPDAVELPVELPASVVFEQPRQSTGELTIKPSEHANMRLPRTLPHIARKSRIDGVPQVDNGSERTAAPDQMMPSPAPTLDSLIQSSIDHLSLPHEAGELPLDPRESGRRNSETSSIPSRSTMSILGECRSVTPMGSFTTVNSVAVSTAPADLLDASVPPTIAQEMHPKLTSTPWVPCLRTPDMAKLPPVLTSSLTPRTDSSRGPRDDMLPHLRSSPQPGKHKHSGSSPVPLAKREPIKVKPSPSVTPFEKEQHGDDEDLSSTEMPQHKPARPTMRHSGPAIPQSMFGKSFQFPGPLPASSQSLLFLRINANISRNPTPSLAIAPLILDGLRHYSCSLPATDRLQIRFSGVRAAATPSTHMVLPSSSRRLMAPPRQSAQSFGDASLSYLSPTPLWPPVSSPNSTTAVPPCRLR